LEEGTSARTQAISGVLTGGGEVQKDESEAGEGEIVAKIEHQREGGGSRESPIHKRRSAGGSKRLSLTPSFIRFQKPNEKRTRRISEKWQKEWKDAHPQHRAGGQKWQEF